MILILIKVILLFVSQCEIVHRLFKIKQNLDISYSEMSNSLIILNFTSSLC